MAVSSGYYGLTLIKQFKNTDPGDIESTTVSAMLVLDAEAPNFDTHDFRNDLIQEVVDGSGYTNGGKALGATPSLTISTNTLEYDSPDPAWATSTITNAEAAVLFWSTGLDTTDELILMSDFGAPVSTANGTLTVTVAATGWVVWDYVP